MIDTATNTVVDTVPFTGSNLPGVAVSPDGVHAYVTENLAGRLSTITLDAAPLASATVGSADPAYGQVAVTLHATDPAGEAVSVTNAAPSGGEVTVVDNGSGTWTYTYTPTDAARVRAGTTPGADTDSFTVTVTDAFGVATTVPVSVPIAPVAPTVISNIPATSPWGLAVTPQGTAYLTRADSYQLTMIDTAAGSPIGTVDIGGSPYQVVVSSDGTRAYVTNQGSNSLSIIDTASNTNLGSIPLSSTSRWVAISPDGTRAYVTLNNNSVRVVDTGTKALIATIPIGGGGINGIALSPDGNRAFVAGMNSVSVIDTNPDHGAAYNTVIATIPVAGSGWEVAVSPDSTRAYVTNQGTSSVTVINTGTNSVAATIPVGGPSFGVTLSPDGSLAYVTTSSAVKLIDTATNTVIATVPVASTPRDVVVTPSGTIYSTNTSAGSISVISLVPTT